MILITKTSIASTAAAPSVDITNPTETIDAQLEVRPKVLTGPTTGLSGNQLVYILDEYSYKNITTSKFITPTTEQQTVFDADKDNISWAIWLSGGLMDGKKDIIKLINRSLQSEVEQDFTQVTNATTFITNVGQNGFLEAIVETETVGGEKKNKLTITFSKWLDGYTVYVEPYRHSPDKDPNSDENPGGDDYSIGSQISVAQPLITDLYWLNADGNRIMVTGHNVPITLCAETLGLTGNVLGFSLMDSDSPLPVSSGDAIKWNGGLDTKIATVSERKTTVAYKVEAIDAAAYANAKTDELNDTLEVYVRVSSDNAALQLTLEDTYGEIDFTPSSGVKNAFFAKKTTRNNGDTTTTDIYTKLEKGFIGSKAFLVAECANMEGQEVTLTVYDDTGLLASAGQKLPLLVGTQQSTDIKVTVKDGFAYAEVQFQEVDSTVFNTWETKLEKDTEEDLIAKLYVNVEHNGEVNVFDDQLFDLKTSSIIYEISTNGINKYDRAISKKAKYTYNDSSNKVHYLFRVDFSIIAWIGSPTQNYIYPKLQGQLVDIRKIKRAYNSDDVKYNFKKLNVGSKYNRYYIDIDALACMLGAMIEESIEDLRFHGFSSSNGGSGGSKSHWNGMTGDLGYLNINNDTSFTTNIFNPSTITNPNPNKVKSSDFDYERQVRFNKALFKFGFSKYSKNMLTEEFKLNSTDTKVTVLPHAIHYVKGITRHYHHLHVAGLDLSFINIIK